VGRSRSPRLLKRRSLAVIGAWHCRRTDKGGEAGRRCESNGPPDSSRSPHCDAVHRAARRLDGPTGAELNNRSDRVRNSHIEPAMPQKPEGPQAARLPAAGAFKPLYSLASVSGIRI
jgi:hypothetical protein